MPPRYFEWLGYEPKKTIALMLWLHVPYKEKDQAKALGARWDATEGKWYVPEGSDPSVFQRWRSHQSVGRGGEALDAPKNTDNKPQALVDFLQTIENAIRRAVPGNHWVVAEIANIKSVQNGHIRFELVQCGASGEQIAHVQAIAFDQVWRSLLNRFKEQTGAEPERGMNILWKVKANFHKRYGLDLHITDVDPAYTLGDLERRRRTIRETLIRENLIDRNCQLPQPKEFCGVAVLSPSGAAGLGDFLSDAEPLARLGLCQFRTYSATFEGPNAAASISAELDKILADHARNPLLGFDAIVLVRGGGASTGLSWLDHIEIARRVCLAPIPVIVGIGHERDKVLLDELSCLSFDTPSKVIGYVRNCIIGNVNQAANDLQRIHRIGLRATNKTQTDLSNRREEVLVAAGKQLDTTKQVAMEKVSAVKLSGLKLVEQSRREIDQYPPQLARWTSSQLDRANLWVQRHVHAAEKKLSSNISGVSAQLEEWLAAVIRNSPRALQSSDQEVASYYRLLLSAGREAMSVFVPEIRSLGSLFADRALAVVRNTAFKVSGECGRLDAHGNRLLSRAVNRIDSLFGPIGDRAFIAVERASQSVQKNLESVVFLGPEQTLKRGYAIVSGEKGIAKSAENLATSEKIEIRFKDGIRKAHVTE